MNDGIEKVDVELNDLYKSESSSLTAREGEIVVGPATVRINRAEESTPIELSPLQLDKRYKYEYDSSKKERGIRWTATRSEALQQQRVLSRKG